MQAREARASGPEQGRDGHAQRHSFIGSHGGGLGDGRLGGGAGRLSFGGVDRSGEPLGPMGRPRGRKPRVLFLCTGNSARSQMAEALLESRSGGAVDARSAGSHPKVLHPNAIRVMAERGVGIGGRPTKHLSRFARSRFDRVITLCDKVKEICPEFPGQPAVAHWSMADPADGEDDDSTYPAFVRTADEIDQRVGLLIADLGATNTREEHT